MDDYGTTLSEPVVSLVEKAHLCASALTRLDSQMNDLLQKESELGRKKQLLVTLLTIDQVVEKLESMDYQNLDFKKMQRI